MIGTTGSYKMKRFFARGLAALLPLVLTIAVFYWVFNLLYSTIGIPLGDLLYRVLHGSPPPEELPWNFPTIGFIVGLFLVLLIGAFVSIFLGRWLLRLIERILKQLPIIRVVYPYAKQLTEFFVSAGDDKKMEFKSTVAVPFPIKGQYSIGFVTSEGLKHLNEAVGKHLLCVFVPMAPTPFTGFVVYVPREDVLPLPISVNEALRLFISAGVLTPEHQTVSIGEVMPGAPGPIPTPNEKGPGLDKKPPP